MGAQLRELRDDPFQLLCQLEAQLQTQRLDESGQLQSWTGLAFRLGPLWMLVPQMEVREVVTPPKTTRVPNAKPWIMGMANARGELLSIIDLRRLLDMPHAEGQRAQRVMVFNSTEVPAGFLVDEVIGYRQFSPADQKRDLIENATTALSSYLLGGFVREGQPWLVMSLHKIAQSDVFKHAGVVP